MTGPAYPTFTLAERDRRWAIAREVMDAEGVEALIAYGEHECTDPAPFAPDAYFSNDRPGAIVIFVRDAEPVSLVWSTMSICDHITARERGEGVWIRPENMYVGKSADRIVEILRKAGLERGQIGVLGLEPYPPWHIFDPAMSYGMWSAVLRQLPEATFTSAQISYYMATVALSDQELACVRYAADVANEMAEAMRQAAAPGVHEGELCAAAMAAAMRRGCSAPKPLLFSGPGFTAYGPPAWSYRPQAPRVLQDGDVVISEVFNKFAMYESQSQVAMAIGEVHQDILEAESVARAAYEAGLTVARPGYTFGDLVEAGQPATARVLAADAALIAVDPLARARLAWLLTWLGDGRTDLATACRALLELAERLGRVAPRTAAFVYLDAFGMAWQADEGLVLADISNRVAAAPLRRGTPRRIAGTVAALSAQDTQSLQPLRELVLHHRAPGLDLPLHERVLIAGWEVFLGGDAAASEAALALIRDCRIQQANGLLPAALALAARADVYLGRYTAARVSAAEGLRTADAHYVRDELAGILAYVAALRGDEPRCRPGEIAASHLAGAWAACGLGLLDLAQGRPGSALRRFDELAAGPARRTGMALFALPDQVEAAVRANDVDQAKEPAARFEEWAAASGQPWAEAVALRCAALLAGDDEADGRYQAALRRHAGGGRPLEHARTHLLYGEWLRRARRRGVARHHLATAVEMFEQLGAAPFVDRARAELRAAGQAPASACISASYGRLTPREAEVVRLAAAGLSNREVGARLFLSSRTVGYHLYKAFPKLGIANRNELARLDLR